MILAALLTGASLFAVEPIAIAASTRTAAKPTTSETMRETARTIRRQQDAERIIARGERLLLKAEKIIAEGEAQKREAERLIAEGRRAVEMTRRSAPAVGI